MKKSKKQIEIEIKIKKLKEKLDYIPEIDPDDNYPRR